MSVIFLKRNQTHDWRRSSRGAFEEGLDSGGRGAVPGCFAGVRVFAGRGAAAGFVWFVAKGFEVV